MNVLKKVISLAIVTLSAVGITSCDCRVYDDLIECPQGVIFKFHTQTPCAAEPSYPASIRETRVFAFDEQGVLMDVFGSKDVSLSADYEQMVDYVHIGTTSFVAWGSEDLSRYDFSAFESGKTTKQEMMVALKRQVNEATADMPHLFVGEPVAGAITQIDRSKLGTHYDIVDFRMKQLTNTIHLTVRGLDPKHTYTVVVEAANSKYDILGQSLPDDRVTYTLPGLKRDDSGVLHADFNLLQLARHRQISLRVFDTMTGKEVYTADLVDDLIGTAADDHTANLNIDCLHDFKVDITLEEKSDETYIAVSAYIIKWNIVFRTVDL